MKVEYSSNNSGGSWWLKDEHWHALEKAGWKVEWFKDQPNRIFKPNAEGRWLGALASNATLEGCSSLREAADKWEAITGQIATDAGCPCCGKPHNFTLYGDDGEYIESGPHTSYGASW